MECDNVAFLSSEDRLSRLRYLHNSKFKSRRWSLEDWAQMAVLDSQDALGESG